MRLAFVLLSSLVFFGTSSYFVSGTDTYPDTYDNIDADTILNSNRLFQQYMDCILDKGACTADGRSLKRILPDAIATTCEKCNAKQRQMARKIGNHMREHRLKDWEAFLKKYDPNKEYITAFEQFLTQKD